MLPYHIRLIAVCMLVIETSPFSQARDWWDRHPRSIAIASDGVTLAAASADRFVRVWNTTNGKLTQKIALDQPGRCLAFLGTKSDLAVGDNAGKDSTVSIWKKKDGQYTKTSQTAVHGMVVALAASPDGKWVVAVTVYGHICFIDSSNGTLRRVWQESGNGIHDIAFSSDGKTLYTAGQAFRAWDVKAEELAESTATMKNNIPDMEREWDEKKYTRFYTGNAIAVAPLPGRDAVLGIGWFANTKGTSSDLTLFDGPKGEKKTNIANELGDATFMAVSADGKKLLIGMNNTQLQLWDIRGGKKTTIETKGLGWLRAGVFLRDGNQAAITNDETKRVDIIDLRTGKAVQTLENEPARSIGNTSNSP
ncbi:MAG: WD40 repeat domain-containing protein [Gemmataceae bacterium]